jgi:hypothetical protein
MIKDASEVVAVLVLDYSTQCVDLGIFAAGFSFSLGIFRVELRLILFKIRSDQKEIGASNQLKRAAMVKAILAATVAALREYEVHTLYTSQKIQ